jgi:hypothetical protein
MTYAYNWKKCKSWRKELKVGERQKAKKGVRWMDVGGGGNEYKMVPEIKTLELCNEEAFALFSYLNTRANLQVLQHGFKWTIRLGSILTELSVPNAKTEGVAKQKFFLFYFLFFFSFFLLLFLLFYFISGLNFYRVLTHLAVTWKKKGWSPTWKNSWRVDGGFIMPFLFSAEQRPHRLFYIRTAETSCCFWSEAHLFLYT